MTCHMICPWPRLIIRRLRNQNNSRVQPTAVWAAASLQLCCRSSPHSDSEGTGTPLPSFLPSGKPGRGFGDSFTVPCVAFRKGPKIALLGAEIVFWTLNWFTIQTDIFSPKFKRGQSIYLVLCISLDSCLFTGGVCKGERVHAF